MSRAPAAQKRPPSPKTYLWICAALILATLAVYAQVWGFDFVNFDDPDYVTNNPHVRAGITATGLVWAFTSGEAANWFPVTRISHMLDFQLFGLRSGWHHLTNLLLHALAAVLLFAFLDRATKARWPSAFVAFIFALHPLHVESVAWVSERKDVLSAVFWFLALWAYVRYAERPDPRRYLIVLAAFVLGLMSKPMIVTLPFVLLLLDVWPLRRPFTSALLREKVPFFVLSVAAAIVTYSVQHQSGAVKEFANLPFGLRLENALVSYLVYIGNMFWPAKLAVFYPYPPEIPAWEAGLAAVCLAGITALAMRSFRSRLYLAVGWLWFLGTLVPVIGLIQVGAQARADRYMYVPMIGLTIMLAWGAVDLLKHIPRAAQILSAVAVLCCIPITWAQAQSWKNSETLFRHALAVTNGNYLAEHNLGNALLDQPGRLDEAVTHLEAALKINPDSVTARTDLGNALAKMPGRSSQAIVEYETATRLNPDAPIPHNNLGSALAKAGRPAEAIAQFQTALRLDPDYAEAHCNLANVLAETPGRSSDAIAEYEAALRIQPDYARAHNGLGLLLSAQPSRLMDALAHFEEALRLQPDYVEAHINLASLLSEIPNRLPDAISHYQAALKINPDSTEAHYNLGIAFSKDPAQLPGAIREFEAALRLKPDDAEAHNNLGVALSRTGGRAPEAIAHFNAALKIRPDYADAHYNLGVALSEIPGRTAEALTHLEAALRLKPDPQLAEAVARLRSHR